jgi:methionyl-tRNA synthetase
MPSDTEARPPYYVTTAIPYVNARPHLGFALELVVADVLARHRRARGRAVRFVTGTDEHSLKNVLAAERAGVPVERFVAEHAEGFRALGTLLDLSCDHFVRTSTDAQHAQAVRALWQACERSGDLYRAVYRGLYCVGCERFYEPGELAGDRCPEHDEPLEVVDEENWFFRLSRHRERVHDAIASGALRVEPESAREETLTFLRGPVRDLSVSRSARRAHGFGLRVPGDDTQVIYVWFDALAYYLAAARAEGTDFWHAPASERVHVIGKGVTRFHAVFWPAFLLSAGLPLPDRLLVHGYLTVDGQKISKSRGGLDPEPLVERYGVDAVRYYLLRQIRTTRDGDFRAARLVESHDAELANGLGNLASRVLALIARAGGLDDEAAAGVHADDAPLSSAADGLATEIDDAVERFALDEALAAIFRLVDAANAHIVRTAPWQLLRQDDPRARQTLRAQRHVLRTIARELAPFLPRAAAALEARLERLPAPGEAPLFPRLAS